MVVVIEFLDPSQKPTMLSPAEDAGEGVAGTGVAVGTSVGEEPFRLKMQPLTAIMSTTRIVDTINDDSRNFKKIAVPY
jgi:hypothetical protein